MLDLLKIILSKILKKLSKSSKIEKDDRISIGIGTYGVNINSIYIWKKNDIVTIGNYCSIAPGVKIIASGEHNYYSISNYPLKSMLLKQGIEFDTFSKGPVIIGNDVWIGYRAIILSGVKIGDGAVIGAGSIVVDDVPDFAIVAGVPAKVIKHRFKQKDIIALKKIAWWFWEERLIKERIPDLYSDMNNFIKKYLPK